MLNPWALRGGEDGFCAVTESRPFDFHCPDLPQEGSNMHSDSCRAKQKQGGPCSWRKCSPGMTLTGRTLADIGTRDTGRKPMGYCECGEKAMNPAELKRRGIKEPICAECQRAKRADKRRKK